LASILEQKIEAAKKPPVADEGRNFPRRHVDGVKFGPWIKVKEDVSGCYYECQGFFKDGLRILQTHFEPKYKLAGNGLVVENGKVEAKKPSGKLQRDPTAKYWQVI